MYLPLTKHQFNSLFLSLALGIQHTGRFGNAVDAAKGFRRGTHKLGKSFKNEDQWLIRMSRMTFEELFSLSKEIESAESHKHAISEQEKASQSQVEP